MSGGIIDLGEVRCETCPVGRASGADRGQFCPFITREYAAGELLCTSGEPATYVWLVKKGLVGLGLSVCDLDQLDALRMPGAFIGLECLVADTYVATARAVSRVSLCGATRAGFLRWVRGDEERLSLVMRAALHDPILTAGLGHGRAAIPATHASGGSP